MQAISFIKPMENTETPSASVIPCDSAGTLALTSMSDNGRSTGKDGHSKNSSLSARVLDIVETSSNPIDSPLPPACSDGLVVGEDGFCHSNSVFDSDLSETASESSQEQDEAAFRKRHDFDEFEEIEHIVELEQTLMLDLTRQQSSFMEGVDVRSADLDKKKLQVEQEDRIRELEAQKARLAEDLQQRTSELRAVQSERDSLQQQVEWHQADKLSIEEQIDEMAEEVDSVLRSLDEAEEVNEAQAKRIRLLEEQLETQQLESSSQNHDYSETLDLSRLEQAEETVRLQADDILSNGELRTKQITILKDQVALESHLGDHANSDEQVSVLEKELKSQSLVIATLEKNMRLQRESLEQQLGTAILQLKQSQSMNASQTKQIEALGVELDKRKREQLAEAGNKTSRISKLEEQNEELLAAISELLHRSLPQIDADASERSGKERSWRISETESEDSDSSVASSQLLSADFSAWAK